MTGESDEDLPLHDEARARSKWRGGETLIDGDADSGPASEIDNAAQGGGDGGGRSEGKLLDHLAQRPPD
jgi:hypothetical protein